MGPAAEAADHERVWRGGEVWQPRDYYAALDGGVAGRHSAASGEYAGEDSAVARHYSVDIDGLSLAHAEYSRAAGWLQPQRAVLRRWQEEAGVLRDAGGI